MFCDVAIVFDAVHPTVANVLAVSSCMLILSLMFLGVFDSIRSDLCKNPEAEYLKLGLL
jgi:hypothetical protein